jgi:hypothetical protein
MNVRGGGEELPQAEDAHYGHGAQIGARRAVTDVGSGRGCLMRPRPGLDSSCGYTFVETLFVVALIALLAAIAVPQLMVSVDRSRAWAAARYLSSRWMRRTINCRFGGKSGLNETKSQ